MAHGALLLFLGLFLGVGLFSGDHRLLYFNIGKSPLRNVTVNLSGAGLFPTSSVFLGDIQPGQAGYGEMKVFVGMLSMTEGYTESYGKTSAVYLRAG